MTARSSERFTVGVVPAAERLARRRLFDALERVYPVRFEGRDGRELRGLDAIVFLGPAGALSDASGIPSLVAAADEVPQADADALALALADHLALARPLRGARLTDRYARAADRPHRRAPAAGSDILARVDGEPVWWLEGYGSRHCVAVSPAELAEGEALRNRLTVGRCLALLALSSFLRALTEGRRWQSPPLRAAFVIDDPNLRRPTYGHVNYAHLRRSAAEHRYHVAIAMVPLDGRLAHPRMVRLFREAQAELSLTTHGNNHDGPEFGRVCSHQMGVAMAAQAARRTSAFSRRTGVDVDPVMVPPHERLSEAASAALVTAGFEALCHTRPFPWLSHSPDLAWLTRPSDADPLLGWGSSDVLPDGLPLVLRRAWDFPREDLILRAYLGQPLVLSGHHDLLERGLGGLEEAAAQINRLGDVRWCSLATIARSAADIRRRGEILEVRMLGRRILQDVPAGVMELRIDLSEFAASGETCVTVRGPQGDTVAPSPGTVVALPVAGPGRYELLLPHRAFDNHLGRPGVRLAPLARRLASEGRDRMRPMAARVTLR